MNPLPPPQAGWRHPAGGCLIKYSSSPCCRCARSVDPAPLRSPTRQGTNSFTQAGAVPANLLPCFLHPVPSGKPSASRGYSGLSPREELVTRRHRPGAALKTTTVLDNAAPDGTLQRNKTYRQIKGETKRIKQIFLSPKRTARPPDSGH